MYAYVSNERGELTVINSAPPGYTSCDREGRLPGCRFKFDDPDAQCSSGRTGRPSSWIACMHSCNVLQLLEAIHGISTRFHSA